MTHSDRVGGPTQIEWEVPLRSSGSDPLRSSGQSSKNRTKHKTIRKSGAPTLAAYVARDLWTGAVTHSVRGGPQKGRNRTRWTTR